MNRRFYDLSYFNHMNQVKRGLRPRPPLAVRSVWSGTAGGSLG